MSDSHPLTQRRNVSFADLLDQPFVALPIDYPERRSFWLCDELHGDRPPKIATEVATPDEWLLAVANSTAVAFAAASAAHVYAGRAIAFRSTDPPPARPLDSASTTAGRDVSKFLLTLRTTRTTAPSEKQGSRLRFVRNPSRTGSRCWDRRF
jgi:hypothetical protein